MVNDIELLDYGYGWNDVLSYDTCIGVGVNGHIHHLCLSRRKTVKYVHI